MSVERVMVKMDVFRLDLNLDYQPKFGCSLYKGVLLSKIL